MCPDGRYLRRVSVQAGPADLDQPSSAALYLKVMGTGGTGWAQVATTP